MWRELVLGCSLVLLGSADQRSHPIEVRIDSGAIRGDELEVRGERYTVFKGIPYAAPPVGGFRFKEAVPPAHWRGVMNATQYPPACVQAKDEFRDEELGYFYEVRTSEDCLYLNVFAPSLYTNDTYPVIVFIHGGGYQIGSSGDYRQEPILRHFVRIGSVFVTLNYRLGPMGFVATEDKKLKGNIGLHDIVMALKWVKRNAGVFRGDPERVSVMGQGSGASAASILALSSLTKGLIHQLILLSGTGLTPGAVRDTAVNATWHLQEALNCRAFNSTELLNCLKSRSKDEIMNPPNKPKRVHWDDYQEWVPLVDGYNGVVTEEPIKLLSSPYRSPMPLLIGTNRDESALHLILWGKEGVNLSAVTEEKAKWMINNLTASYSGFNNHQLMIRSCEYEYVETRTDPKMDPIELKKGMLDMYAEFWFHAPASRLAKLYASNSDVYLYSFDHVGHGFFEEDAKWKGAFHGSELVFLFELSSRMDFLENRRDHNWAIDRTVTETFAKLLVNFARTGNPTPPGESELEFNWTRFDPARLNYLSMTDQPENVEGYHWRGDVFWNHYAAFLDGVDVGNLRYMASLERKLSDYQMATWILLCCALFFFAVLVGLSCYCTRKDNEEDDI